MTSDIQTYLKFANVQMAAEALFGKKDSLPSALFEGAIQPKFLTDGNERSRENNWGQTPIKSLSEGVCIQKIANFRYENSL